jgi:hypothetical protein
MPPEERQVVRFGAEPPQDPLPYGRWADTLREEFLAACREIDAGEEEIGEPGDLVFHPDRTWDGRTYVPVTSRSTTGYDIFGYVAFSPGGPDTEPSDFEALADFTDETSDTNPEWRMDLCDEVVGAWRGEHNNVAAMTLVWGVPILPGGRVVTAELAELVVDQCQLMEGRFTLLAPDNYRGDFLEIRLWDGRGQELARESLYEDEEE